MTADIDFVVLTFSSSKEHVINSTRSRAIVYVTSNSGAGDGNEGKYEPTKCILTQKIMKETQFSFDEC